MKEIRWLLNPYVKYGKLYLIISILFAAIILPLDSVLQVYFPQAVLNLLSSHSFTSLCRLKRHLNVRYLMKNCY